MAQRGRKTTALGAVRCCSNGFETGRAILPAPARQAAGRWRLSSVGSPRAPQRPSQQRSRRSRKAVEEGFSAPGTARCSRTSSRRCLLSRMRIWWRGKEITRVARVGEALFGAGPGGVQLNSLLRQTRTSSSTSSGPGADIPHQPGAQPARRAGGELRHFGSGTSGPGKS